MNEVERALSDISDIRSRMAASTRFRGYAPEVVAITGFAALFLMLAQLAAPDSFTGGDTGLVRVWGTMLLVGSLAILGEAVNRSRRQHRSMAHAMLATALRTVAPTGFVILVLTAVVLGRAPQFAWVLPGLWQMLVGIAAFASYATMPRGIAWPSLFYLVAGAVVLTASARQDGLDPVLCGAPFAIGHLWIAYLLGRNGGEVA